MATRWNKGNRVPITMSGFTIICPRYYSFDLDVTPQEGLIFHCAGQASGESRVFDLWDLQAARSTSLYVRPLA